MARDREAPQRVDIPPPPGADRASTAMPPPSTAPGTGQEASHREFVGTGVFWTLVIGTLLAIALVIFVIQNADEVAVEFLGWDWRMSLAGIVLIGVLVGVVGDELAGV